MERLIIFPTDTVYGLGCGIFDKENIEKIYKMKKRPRTKPLACLCSDIKQIKNLAYVSADEEKMIDTFMPGALTLILKCKKDIQDATGYQTIGVRIPNSNEAREILSKHGAMFTTSVNESEETPLNEYDEIVERFGPMVDKVYERHESSSNIASTVVSLLDDKIKVIRQGEITLEDIKKVLGK